MTETLAFGYSLGYIPKVLVETVKDEVSVGFDTINPCNAEATFVQSTRTKRFFKTSKPCHVGTLRWVPTCEGFLHYILLANPLGDIPEALVETLKDEVCKLQVNLANKMAMQRSTNSIVPSPGGSKFQKQPCQAT